MEPTAIPTVAVSSGASLGFGLKKFLEQTSSAGPLAYIAATAVLSMPPVPGASGFLCTLGGVAYGTLLGTVIFVFASTIGASLSMVLARWLLRLPLQKALSSYSKQLKSLDAAVENEAFQIVFLLRLSPIMPFGLATLLLALTSVPFEKFCAGTFLGLLPSSLPFAYAGALTRSLSSADTHQKDPLNEAVTVLGLLATLLVSWKVMNIARTALNNAMGDTGVSEKTS